MKNRIFFTLISFFSCAIILSAQIPTSGLVAHYPFSGNANDASSFAHHGMVSNATLTTDRFGRANNAYAFNGSNSVIQAPDAPHLRPANLTASVWVNNQSTSGFHSIIGKSIGTSVCDSWQMFIYGTASGVPFSAVSCVDAGTGFMPFLLTPRTDNVWTHLVYVFDDVNDRVKLYKDNVLVREDVTSGSIAYDTRPFMIGLTYESNNLDFAFNGTIDDIRLYNRALNTNEIAALYNESTAITSAQNGEWALGSTWIGGEVPTIDDDVIINHTVTNITLGSGSACKNLTINANRILNQNGRLIIGGNLTINGTFDHNSLSSLDKVSTEIGAVSNPQDGSSVSPAGNHLITISGTLSLGGNVNQDQGFSLAGRMVFNTGSTFRMRNNSRLTLTGWSDPNDATPQYLMNIDNLTNVDFQAGSEEYTLIRVTNSNGTQPILSTGGDFVETCTANHGASFLLPSSDKYFGGGTRRQFIQPIITKTSGHLYLNNTTVRKLTSVYATQIHSTNGHFSDITCGFASKLFGDYTLVDNCSSSGNNVTPVFSNTGNTFFDGLLVFNVNVSNTALFRILPGTTHQVLGTFNLQSGRVIVQGGTLDLRSNNITGLSATRYFATEVGLPPYDQRGRVLMPITASNGDPNAATTFNLGVTIPNGAGVPTNASVPLNIASATTNNVTVGVQPLTIPIGYVAPQIQWDITPTSMPATLNITYTWPITTEPNSFAANRSSARVYHYNPTTMVWEVLPNQFFIDNMNGTFSIKVIGITAFSPFDVMIPKAVLKAELIDFTAKLDDNKAELNWQTASENKVQNYEIEKSFDGKTFLKIVETKANNAPSVYQAFDEQFSTSAYYRLKINDLDGVSNYSKIVHLEGKGTKTPKIIQYTEGSISIETNDKIELITITNTIGQVIKFTKEKRFLINELNAGIYIISVKTDKGFLSKKIFKE